MTFGLSLKRYGITFDRSPVGLMDKLFHREIDGGIVIKIFHIIIYQYQKIPYILSPLNRLNNEPAH